MRTVLANIEKVGNDEIEVSKFLNFSILDRSSSMYLAPQLDAFRRGNYRYILGENTASGGKIAVMSSSEPGVIPYPSPIRGGHCSSPSWILAPRHNKTKVDRGFKVVAGICNPPFPLPLFYKTKQKVKANFLVAKGDLLHLLESYLYLKKLGSGARVSEKCHKVSLRWFKMID